MIPANTAETKPKPLLCKTIIINRHNIFMMKIAKMTAIAILVSLAAIFFTTFLDSFVEPDQNHRESNVAKSTTDEVKGLEAAEPYQTKNEEIEPIKLKDIENKELINLTGTDIFLIKDSHYVHHNKIFLHDDSVLIIEDSVFEHRHDYSFEHILEARGNSKVIVTNSEIQSSDWLNWNFFDNSSLVLDNVKQDRSNIWHWFPDNSKLSAQNSRVRATLDGNASFYIENGTETFVEIVWKTPGIVVDEYLPKKTGYYKFPNENDFGVDSNLTMKNTETSGWGITAAPRGDITVRDVDGAVVTWSFAYPWEMRTIVLEDLKSGYYADKTWDLGDNTKLRLVNTTVMWWSPIVGGDNTMIIRRSDLADNAFNSGDGKVVIEDSTLQFARAKNNVQITLRNSKVSGDVVAQDNGKIILVNTEVGGKIVEEGNGKIFVE